MNDQWLIMVACEAMKNRADDCRFFLVEYRKRYLPQEVAKAKAIWQPLPEAVKRAVRHEITDPNYAFIFNLIESDEFTEAKSA